MNKKTLLTSLLLLCVTVVTYAQERKGGNNAAPSRNEFLLKDPIWFISIGGGVQTYFGEDDAGAPGNRISLTKRLTAAPTISFGRRMSNLISLRAQLSGGSLHGFNDGWSGAYTRRNFDGSTGEDFQNRSKDPQWDYMGWKEGTDYTFGEVDQSGVKVWHPLKWGENGGYYMQHMRYVSMHGDIMLNLLNLIGGYTPLRKFEINPFVGVGGYQRLAHNGNLKGTFVGGSLGLNLGFKLSKNFALYAEGRGTIVSDEFDGQTGAMSNNGIAQATMGLTYKFGEPKYIDPAIDRRLDMPYNIARSCDKMVLVSGGNIRLGTGIDPLWGDTVSRKLVAVSPFWMDETEVTNKQYREFVFWVRDSIIRERLSDPGFGGDPTYKVLVRPSNRNLAEGNINLQQRLNWKKNIPWKNPTEREAAAIASVVGDGANLSDKAGVTNSALNYVYEWFDFKSYYAFLSKLKEGDTRSMVISKDTAYVDGGGNVVRETLSRVSSGSMADFSNTYIMNVYPDVTSWVSDFANAKNEEYVKNYFTNIKYNNYPVVGVSWEQADAFCAWRTDRYRESGKCDMTGFEGYRLPTEAEWEFGARNGNSNLDYPWYSNKTQTIDGLSHANFKGSEDLKNLMSAVGTFHPNRFGLHDMAGNVSEWTTTTFTESVDRMADEANPDFSYRAVLADPKILKRKIVKGGSWKDTSVKSGERAVEYQDRGRSYIGFRCVRSWTFDDKNVFK